MQDLWPAGEGGTAMNATANKSDKRFGHILRYTLVGGLLLSVAIMAATILHAIFVDDFEELNGRWLFTGMVGLIYSAMLLSIAVSSDSTPKLRVLSTVTTGFLVLSAFLWLLLIWTIDNDSDSENFAKFCVTLGMVTVGLALSCQMFALETRFTWLRYVIYGTVALLFFEIALITTIIYEVIDNFVGWIAVPIGIMTVLALIVVPLLVKLLEKGVVQAAESIPMRLKLNMTCPQCEQPQFFSNGTSRCTNCKALLVIEIEEPRCECGYLLYQLASAVCPECGRVVPDDQRWLGSSAPTSSINVRH